MSTETRDAYHLSKALAEGEWFNEWRARINCGAQALETVTTEPTAVFRTIFAAARSLKLPVITWDCVSGLVGHGVKIDEAVRKLAAPPDPDNPQGTGDAGLLLPFSAITAPGYLKLPQAGFGEGSAAFVLYNFLPFFADPTVSQRFENMVKEGMLSYRAESGKLVRHPIHFVQSPYRKEDVRAVDAVRHWITPMPFPLPDEREILEEHVDRMLEQVAAKAIKRGKPVSFGDEYRRAVAAACRGLERHAVSDVCFYVASRRDGVVDDRTPIEIRKEAGKRIAESAALEVVPEEDILPPEQLGGIDNALRRVEAAARTYTDAARAQALDPASGLYMIGLGGTGKSELSKTISVVFQRTTHRAFTVLRVRMGALFGSLVGETQQNWYDIERRVAAFGPDTVVWMDEVDKAFGGVMDGGGDSGVRKDLFGLVLSWMSNPHRRCFVVAAMNTPEGIPPEFFRRFDAGFFFDLPGAVAREEIVRIHFAKRLARLGLGLDALGFDACQWRAIAQATEGWIPSELESLVKQARDLAFARTGVATPTYDDVHDVIKATGGSILSVQKREAFSALKSQCRHALPVATADPAGDGDAPAAGGHRALVI